MQRHPLRSLSRAGALLLAGTVAFTACGDDDGESIEPTEETGDPEVDQTPDDGVALLAAGEQDKVVLTPAYEVGQSSTMTMDMDLGIDAAGQSVALGLQMTMASEVTDVTDESSTVAVTVEDVRVTDGPPGAEEQLRTQFGPVIGGTIVIEYDENGQQTGTATLESGEELPEELRSSFENATQTAFPTEEVGVGSRWSAVIATESNGVELEVTTVYELVEITDGQFVIDVSQQLPLDEEIDGTRVEGDLNGSGKLRIDRQNPLLLDMTYKQSTEASADGQSLSFDLDLDVDSK